MSDLQDGIPMWADWEPRGMLTCGGRDMSGISPRAGAGRTGQLWNFTIDGDVRGAE